MSPALTNSPAPLAFLNDTYGKSFHAATTDTVIEARKSPAPRDTGRLISFVIPVKNECETLRELLDRILANLPVDSRAEIIFIDDGSTDSSWDVIQELTARRDATIRGIQFRSNVGKAAALTAGFRAASGEIVFTMDADLQDDPIEIPNMLKKLAEGYDIVSGWKKVRHDPWHKVLPSRIFNWMVSKACGVKLHDHNCGFKCYRGEVTRQLTLHGELHRMVPSLAAILGFRTTEVAVQHHPRRHGYSKYGIERFVRGFFDMITVGFLRRFGERPSHLLGQVALVHAGVGGALLLAGLLLGLGNPAGQTVVIVGALALAAAAPLMACGLLAELIIRGGLPANWRLPIVADTALNNSTDASSSEARRIPLAYVVTR